MLPQFDALRNAAHSGGVVLLWQGQAYGWPRLPCWVARVKPDAQCLAGRVAGFCMGSQEAQLA